MGNVFTGIQDWIDEEKEKSSLESCRKTADLMNYLWSNGRGDEAKRASLDKTLMDQLFAEYANLTPAK